MTTYAKAGVNIEEGDKASKSAYNFAKATFKSRENLIGQPVTGEDGFAGFIDMGEFYYAQCCDTVGTKIMIAEKTQNFAGLGFDLLCMVCDDAVCTGAETVSVTNTFETNKINSREINAMMESLSKACIEQKVAIVGGEIAEVGAMTNGTGWGADAVGIVEKDKVITGKDVQDGDFIVGLASAGFRCNGFSLIRKILADNFGEDWAFEKYNNEKTWGEMVLTPSRIFSDFVLSLIGRFKKSREISVHGIVHMTGGGMHNLFRIIKGRDLGFIIDNPLPPQEMMLKLQELGNVADREAYKTWNMGMGMALIVDPADVDKVLAKAKSYGIPAQVVGKISSFAKASEDKSRNISQEIHLAGKGLNGEKLVFKK